MPDKKQFMCPRHNVLLKKTKVMYGMPDPKIDYGDVIFGGCCEDTSRPYGYVCPVDEAVYYLDFDGKLYTEDEEDLGADSQN